MRYTRKLAATLLLAAAIALPATAAELATRKSSERGVTVAVTPQNLAPGAPAWEFKVVLDTHSADLNDDLVKSAVLLDGAGGKHAPIAWEGAGPGGHHREGVLRFKPIAPPPAAVELRIQRPGEAKPRSFSWQLP
ncbi:MAG: hypothetical protein IT529_08810 [Burkholderiales bacterium]|nr:hypothetical protein [Burkholderiales bacterium]